MHKNDKYFKDVANWSEEWGVTKRPLGIIKNELELLRWDYVEDPTNEKYKKILYIQGELDGYGFE